MNKNNNQNKPKKENKKLNIKRPIIFICNDPYSRGLKKLR